MKNLYLAVISCTLLFACKNQKQADIDLMVSKIKTNIEEHSFKNNRTIDLIEFKFLKCDTINENMISKGRISSYLEKWDLYDKDLKMRNADIEAGLATMRSYRDLNFRNLLDSEHAKIKLKIEELSPITDSLAKYDKLIDAEEAKMKKNLKPKPVYKISMFIKATVKDKVNSENYLDTTYYAFNKDLNLIN